MHSPSSGVCLSSDGSVIVLITDGARLHGGDAVVGLHLRFPRGDRPRRERDTKRSHVLSPRTLL